MTLYTRRIRRATLAAVERLRRAGSPVHRATLAAAMGCTRTTAAHRLKVLAEMGVIRVDPLGRWSSAPATDSDADLRRRVEAVRAAARSAGRPLTPKEIARAAT